MSSRGSLFKRSSCSEFFFTFIPEFYRVRIENFDKTSVVSCVSSGIKLNYSHFLVKVKIGIYWNIELIQFHLNTLPMNIVFVQCVTTVYYTSGFWLRYVPCAARTRLFGFISMQKGPLHPPPPVLVAALLYSFFYIHNCLPARLMINRENPGKSQFGKNLRTNKAA